MEQPDASRSWRPAASPDRPTPARTPVVSRPGSVSPALPSLASPQCYSSESRNLGRIFCANAKRDLAILYFPSSLVAASPRRAVGGGTLGPALNQENYETNPKQIIRILFKCNGF
jgi:hypothetical protein